MIDMKQTVNMLKIQTRKALISVEYFYWYLNQNIRILCLPFEVINTLAPFEASFLIN
jgi:hypothetical protein